MQILDFQDKVVDAHVKWEVSFFWSFGISTLYYMYYRNLFLSISGWGAFFLYQFLHILTEIGPPVQLSDQFIAVRNAVFRTMARCVKWCGDSTTLLLPGRCMCCECNTMNNDGSRSDIRANGGRPLPKHDANGVVVNANVNTVDEEGGTSASCGCTDAVARVLSRMCIDSQSKRTHHRQKLLQQVWIKEAVRVYTLIIQAIFLPFIRAYRNARYYPSFSTKLSQSQYTMFMTQLSVMLGLELLSSIVLYCLLRWTHGISILQTGTNHVVFHSKFVLCLLLFCVHLTNDPWFSLFECNHIV